MSAWRVRTWLCAAILLASGASSLRAAETSSAAGTDATKPAETAAPASSGTVAASAEGKATAEGKVMMVPGPGGVMWPGGPSGLPTPGMPAGVTPSKPGEPGKAEEKKPDQKEEPPPLTRPTSPPKPPDPAELRVKPDAQGKIQFNFKGQPWPAVLEWLADLSGASLDWQELPGDYLNLTTPRPYTLREARDLINRHLLARGYTLLAVGDTLSVVNCKKLNPALVPRVDPEELAQRDPHEFVKVLFDLKDLVAEEAAEEFKPLLSPNGRLVALRSSNRLEAMDAVINLRSIQGVLESERSGTSGRSLPREFPLRYAKAAEVVDQLYALLGMEAKVQRRPTQPSGPMPSGISPVEGRMMVMPGQPMPGQPQPGQPHIPGQPSAAPGATKAKIEVSLVANVRKNSVLAVAPPDKMAIIAQAIEVLDVPSRQGSPLAGTVTRMQIYRLAAIDPEPLVKTLEEIGDLDPSTRLQADKKNRAIIAYAPLADHVTIRALIEKLDGSERKFEVIQLRRLKADYVAGSIEFMMTGEKPKPQRRPYWYYDFDSRSRPQEEERDRFRVDADVENNRLLLWANSIELEEVRNLLAKLGEIPQQGAASATVRVLDLPPGPETESVIEQLQRHWPAVAPNPLVVPPDAKPRQSMEEQGDGLEKPRRDAKTPPQQPRKTVAPPAGSPAWPGKPVESRAASEPQPATLLAQALVPPRAGSDSQLVGEAPAPGGEQRGPNHGAVSAPRTGSGSPVAQTGQNPPPPAPSAPPAPITISRDAAGRWVVSSQDTEALDRLEDLVAQLSAATRTDYRIFRLNYAWATSVAAILKDVFKEEDETQRRPSYPYFFYDYGYGPEESDKPRARLSKRKPLRIIADSDTNSILVQGGDAGQLKKIEELIEIYDRPPPVDARSVRKTRMITLRYARAKTVADAVKDVYRDLLSSNDKALAGQQQQRGERTVRFVFEDEEKKQPTYKGLLSLGVDDVSNSLVVSAPAYLLEEVEKLIEELDQAAEPAAETVSVVQLGPGLSAAQVEAALGGAFRSSTGATRGESRVGRSAAPSKTAPSSRGQRGSAESSGERSTRHSSRNGSR